MERISQHISWNEAVNSSTAAARKISNVPDAHTIINMKILADKCFEPLRRWYGKPIRINSFYRSPELNTAIGGSKTSQHCKGEAIDISAGSLTENKKLFDWCKANLIFDQLIYEFGDDTGPQWVHISFKAGANRNMAFRLPKK
jgi:zinc D-Ala-D-Ala carboxypeptidase